MATRRPLTWGKRVSVLLTRAWPPDVWHSYDDAGHVTLLYGLWRATPFKLQKAHSLYCQLPQYDSGHVTLRLEYLVVPTLFGGGGIMGCPCLNTYDDTTYIISLGSLM